MYNELDYNPETVRTFKIISLHASDLLYNHVYISARSVTTNKNKSSILETYREMLFGFMCSIQNNENSYRDLLQGVFKYYHVHSHYQVRTLTEFSTKLMYTFTPIKLIPLTQSYERDRWVKDLIVSSYGQLVGHLTKPDVLTKIIKNRLIQDTNTDSKTQINQDLMRQIQEVMVDILLLASDRIMNNFMKPQNEEPRADLIDKMKGYISSLLKDKHELSKTCNDLNHNIKGLYSQISELGNENKILKGIVEKTIHSRQVDNSRPTQPPPPTLNIDNMRASNIDGARASNIDMSPRSPMSPASPTQSIQPIVMPDENLEKESDDEADNNMNENEESSRVSNSGINLRF